MTPIGRVIKKWLAGDYQVFHLVARIMAAYKVILDWGKTSMHININQVKPVAEMSSNTRMVTLD